MTAAGLKFATMLLPNHKTLIEDAFTFLHSREYKGKYFDRLISFNTKQGQQVLARAENNGRFVILTNGRKYHRQFHKLWDPVFSPDGKNVLLKYIEDDKYCRQVVPVEELLG